MVKPAKHIAKDFMIGNTHIQIATDYCENRTQEEVDRILERIARNAIDSFRAAATA